MVLAIVCHAYRIIEQKKVASFVFSVPLLYFSIVLSQSASSLIAATIVVILTGILYLSKRSAAGVLYWYFLTSAIAVFVFVVFLFPDSLFDALGRDASLTGRIPLWGLVAEAIAKQPFFGYGYAGFWNADSRETQYIWSQADWRPPHAHNGYLEVMLEIGVIGLIVVLWLWGRTARLAFKALRSGSLPSASWVLMLVFLVALHNIDENQILVSDGFNVLMSAALIEVAMWNDRRKKGAVRVWGTGRRPNLETGRIAWSGYLTTKERSFAAALNGRDPQNDPRQVIDGP
jgi:exopolysaccharide production protein ExoQ